MKDSTEEKWDLIIEPQTSLWSIPWRDLWSYRDLLRMFVKRDVITIYKQTILGPIWYVLQPIMTTGIYVLVFGKIAGISTDGLPQVLFYLSGITIWNYFSESFNTTSKTFSENANIFGKVYFPRLIMPLSKVLSALIKFGIQMALFLAVYLYYIFFTNTDIHPNMTLLLFPLYVLLMAFMGLGFGLIFTSLTTKYRDLNFLIQFGVQLLMYATPVIYPMSTIPEKYQWIIELNPLTSILEGFRYGFLGAGSFQWNALLYSTIFTIIILGSGIVIFNRTEKKFIDTI